MQLPGLNEYDSEALIRAIHPEPLPKPTTPELYRHHFRLLREALQQWMSGQTEPAGMPSYALFRQGVVDALQHAQSHHDCDVLLVSSGGPISTAVGQVLGVPADNDGLGSCIRILEFALGQYRAALPEAREASRNHGE